MNKPKGKGTLKCPHTPNKGEAPTEFLANVILHGAAEKNNQPMFCRLSLFGGKNTLVSLALDRPGRFQGKLEVVANDKGLEKALRIKAGRGKTLWYYDTLVHFHVVEVVEAK